MRSFTLRAHAGLRLAAAAAALVAIAGCSSKKSSPDTTRPAAYGITGTVSGAVSAGVTVTLSSDAGSRTTTTNGRGEYLFGGLYDGTYTLEASLQGYSFTPATITVIVNGADVTSQNFTSQPGISIAGTVSGDAKAGVVLMLTGPEPFASTRTTTTAADGSYRFWNVAAGSYRVTPWLAGGWTFVPANTLVTVAGTSLTGPSFTSVAPTHVLSGRVSGAFRSGVPVTLSSSGGDAVALTDANGYYTFSAVAPGSYTVTPSYPGAAFTPPQHNETIAAVDLQGVDFVSAATHSISGRVSGDVLADVGVSLVGAATSPTATAQTDASGFFEFDDLVDGVYSVSPTRAGYSFSPGTRSVTLSGVNVTGVSFTASADPTYTVSGTVGGGIAEGVAITLQGATTAVTTTGAAGLFSLGGVKPGTYLLFPSSDDYTFDPASIQLVVAAADVGGQRFTATLSPTARTISGSVVGAATAGVTVTLVGASLSTPRTTTTDASGRFAFRQLVDGLYLVTPSVPGFVFGPPDCLVTVAGPSVSFVQFQAAHAPLRISGAVTPATAGVTMSLSGDATVVTSTAFDGTYAFTTLANGTYTVKPTLAGYAFSPVEASVTLDGADATSVSFSMAPSHRIAGHVSGDVRDGVRVTLSGAAAGNVTTDAAGYYEFLDLRDGGYVLTPALEGYSFDPLFLPTVLAGADITTADFAASLDPTWVVSGTISGAVSAGVTVDLLGPSLSRSTTTDSGGVYGFSGLSNGSYMVIPSAPGYVFNPASSRAFRIDGANVVGQDFTSVPAP